jgi:hypothetical protein
MASQSLALTIPGEQSASPCPAVGKSGQYSSTYPQEACRAPTEDAVCIADGSLPPRGSTCSSCGRSGRRALDVVVEAFDDISGARLFEVLCLDS